VLVCVLSFRRRCIFDAKQHEKRLAELSVGIVGLGLMGGSLARALRLTYPNMHISGLDLDRETVQQARRSAILDAGTTRWPLPEAVDLLVLALPVRAILRFLRDNGPTLPRGTLVMDLGSTKTDICQALAALPAGVEAVGGHPMCGKERAGWSAGEATLFRHSTFVLCPLPNSSPWALSIAREVATSIGARPLRLDAQRHDRLVAAISHLPYLVSAALMATAAAIGREDPLLWEVAASGFRDTSRLAGSDVTMLLDILRTNREPVLQLLRQYEETLSGLQAFLQADDELALRQALQQIRRRRKWYVERETRMRQMETWDEERT